jgi:hypothetical protein
MKNNKWYNIKGCEIADPYYGYIEFAIIGNEEDLKAVLEMLDKDGYEVYDVEDWGVEE